MMEKGKITRIILFTANTEMMTEFYAQIFGLSIIDKADPGFVILDAGGCQLCLHQIPPQYIDDNDEPREDSFTKICFYLANVDAEKKRLEDLGIRMKNVFQYQGFAFCDGLDPEGNVFQISNR